MPEASGGGARQLALDLTAPAPPAGPVGQLTELPGTEWEHIFDMPAPGDERTRP